LSTCGSSQPRVVGPYPFVILFNIRRKTFTVGYYAMELNKKNLKYGFTEKNPAFSGGVYLF